MSLNIGQLKKQLQTLGISINTPGLNGDERYEELRKRLDEANVKVGVYQTTVDGGSGNSLDSSQFQDPSMPSLNHFSIGEIRSRLTALGESTTTPNMTGDERRNELLRRLINCIMNGEDRDDNSVHEGIVNEIQSSSYTLATPSIQPLIPDMSTISAKESLETPSATLEDISELKKELKRLINKRSIWVASRLSGARQDPDLKACDVKCNKIDAELAQLKTLKIKDSFRSEYITNSSALTADNLISRLETLRSEVKEEIRDHRTRIRLEGDTHPEYGLQIEEQIKMLLSTANLSSAKSGRMKGKVEALRDMDNKLNGNNMAPQSGANTMSMSSKHSNTTTQSQHNLSTTGSSKLNSTNSLSSSSHEKLPIVSPSAAVTQSGAQNTQSQPNIDVNKQMKEQIQLLKQKNTVSTTNCASTKVTASTVVDNTSAISASGKEIKPVLKSSFLNQTIDLTAAINTATAANTDANQDLSVNLSPTHSTPQRETASSLLSKGLVLHKHSPSRPSPSSQSSSASKPQYTTDVTTGGISIDTSPRSARLPQQLVFVKSPNASGLQPGSTAADSKHSSAQNSPFGYQNQNHNYSPDSKAHHSPVTAADNTSRLDHKHSVNAEKGGEDETSDLSDDGDYSSKHQNKKSPSSVRQHTFSRPEGGPSISQKQHAAPSIVVIKPPPPSQSSPTRDKDISDKSEYKEETRPPPKHSPSNQHLSKSHKQSGKHAHSSKTHPVLDEEPVYHIDSTSHSSASASASAKHKPSVTMTPQQVLAAQTAHKHHSNSEYSINTVVTDFTDGDQQLQHDNDISDTDNNDNDDDEDEEAKENNIQIRILREHARTLAGMNDLPAAEQCFERALALDPVNIVTLQQFALFLHSKKGELVRAESFFNRGLQLCLPGLNTSITSARGSSTKNKSLQVKQYLNMQHKQEREGFNPIVSPVISPTHATTTTTATVVGTSIQQPILSPKQLPTVPPPQSQGTKIKHIIRFILSFAHFLTKSNGDIEGASVLYQKAVELAPDDALVLSTFAHFLSQESTFSSGPNSVNSKIASDQAIQLFQRALQIDPSNVNTTMWYAKLLKKLNKFGQAELMYKVALDKSVGDVRLEPTAICNYATFIFKCRKDPVKAQLLFSEGLERFPSHKGLVKNYCTLLRVYTHLGSAEEVRRKTPKTTTANERVERILHSIQSATNVNNINIDTASDTVEQTIITRASTAASPVRIPVLTLSRAPSRSGSVHELHKLENIQQANDSRATSATTHSRIGSPQKIRQNVVGNLTETSEFGSENDDDEDDEGDNDNDSTDKGDGADHVLRGVSETEKGRDKQLEDNDDNVDEDEEEDVSLINNSFIKRLKGTPGLSKKVIAINTQQQQQHDTVTSQNTYSNANNSIDHSANNSVIHTADTSPSELLIPWSESDGKELFYSKKRDSTDDFDDFNVIKNKGVIPIVDAKSGKEVHVVKSVKKRPANIDTSGVEETFSSTVAGKLTTTNSFTATLSPTKSFKGLKFGETD